jgi:predicted amidohydrolase
MPSAFTRPTGQAHWEVLLRARAIETQVRHAHASGCDLHACMCVIPHKTLSLFFLRLF